MGYLHIPNLYRPEAQIILLFKEVYALEKIHGTSAHITWCQDSITFFSGGTKHDTFVKLFNNEKLTEGFMGMGVLDREITVYGESYGGKEQAMGHTYGPVGKFIVFDIQIGDSWLSVPKAEKVANDLGLEFVHYVKVPTDLAALDAERDAPSVQAIRNGVSKLISKEEAIALGYSALPNHLVNGGYVVNPRKREGVVLRPLEEFTANNGSRVICKHKGDDFKETKTPRPVVDPSKQKVFEEAQTVAEEFVTVMRLEHILQKIPDHGMEKMKDIIAAMKEDVNREGVGEFTPSKEVDGAIGKRTAVLYKEYLNSKIAK